MRKQYTDAELAEIQVQKEIEMKTAGIARFNLNNERAIQSNSYSDTLWSRRIIQELVNPMADAIDAYIKYYGGRKGRPNKAISYIVQMSSRQVSYIAIKTIMDALVRGEKLSSLSISIGQRVEDQVRFSGLAENAPKYIEKVMDSLRKAKSRKYSHRKKVLSHTEDKLATDEQGFGTEVSRWQSWPKQDQMHIGAFLIDIFSKNVLFNGEPVIEKRVSTVNLQTEVSIVPTSAIVEWIDRYKEVMEVMTPAYAPCVVQPKNWTSPTSGGYHIEEISSTLPLIKSRKKHRERLTVQQMPEVYQAVNNLQSVPWRIKEEVLDVLRGVIENDLAIAVPSRAKLAFPDAPVPVEFQDLRGEELKSALTTEQWAKFIDWKREKKLLYEMESKRKSDLMKIHRIIGSAEQYREFERLFFVYTLDFRGRVYCKSDTVSPQGDDIQKSLVEFANGKPLGKGGRYWLAVHGANVLGEDKCSFDERVKTIQGMTEEIRDITCDPFTFRQWATADKPWQYLSWCFEWSRLQDHLESGGKEEDFISYLPVAMDGSCSGIQHYSAILRDPVGGSAVNLLPDSKPHDIYGDVAKVALLKLESLSCETKDKDELVIINTILNAMNGINRSITKKAVMTLPYGSTFKRCLESVSAYFAELQAKENKSAKAMKREPVKVMNTSVHPGDGLPLQTDCETYLAKIVWNSIGDVVVAAREGMKFIQSVASYVAQKGHSLEWTAPTGFIVDQLELDSRSTRVKTQLFGETFLRIRESTKKILVRKMRTSSAPNFIHTMDASHLMFTVNGCFDENITDLAVIHDSFGTHACNVPLMRDVLRRELVRMYQENDVLQDFKDCNEGRILEEIPIEIPEKMGLDLDVILKSEYCFA